MSNGLRVTSAGMPAIRGCPRRTRTTWMAQRRTALPRRAMHSQRGLRGLRSEPEETASRLFGTYPGFARPSQGSPRYSLSSKPRPTLGERLAVAAARRRDANILGTPILGGRRVFLARPPGISSKSSPRRASRSACTPHPFLTALPTEEVVREGVGSRLALTQGLGQEMNAFAYPYDPGRRTLLGACGYTFGLGVGSCAAPASTRWSPCHGSRFGEIAHSPIRSRA